MRKTRIRPLAALALAACMALSMMPTALAEGGEVIAVVPKALDNRIFLDTKAGAEAAAAALGIGMEWTGPETSDAQAQAAVVEGLIESGVAGILISCNDAEALTPVLRRAVEAGIAVATFDADAPESGRLFHIGSDNYALGLAAAERLRALLPEGGRVAILEGMPDALNLKTRLQGFYDGIEGSGIECYAPVSGQDDLALSVEAVERFTAETEDLDAWFFVGGWPLFASPEDLPGLRAFAEAGGVVVAVDAAWPMLDFVEAGIVNVLLGQDYAEMGEVGIRTLKAAIDGDAPAEDIIFVGIETVTADNLEEARAGKAAW